MPDAVLVTLGRHHLHALRRPDFARADRRRRVPGGPFQLRPLGDWSAWRFRRSRLRLCLTLMNAVKLQESDVELVDGKADHPLRARAVPGPALPRPRRLRVPGRRRAGRPALPQFAPRLRSSCSCRWPCATRRWTSSSLSRRAGSSRRASSPRGAPPWRRPACPMAPLPIMDPRELAARLEKKPGSFEADSGAAGPRATTASCRAYLQGKTDRGVAAQPPDRGDRLVRRPAPHVELADTAEGEPRHGPRLLPDAGRAPALAGIGERRNRRWRNMDELAKKTGRRLGSARGAHAAHAAHRPSSSARGSATSRRACRATRSPSTRSRASPSPRCKGHSGPVHRREATRRSWRAGSTTTRDIRSRTWSCRSSSSTARGAHADRHQRGGRGEPLVHRRASSS